MVSVERVLEKGVVHLVTEVGIAWNDGDWLYGYDVVRYSNIGPCGPQFMVRCSSGGTFPLSVSQRRSLDGIVRSNETCYHIQGHKK